MPTEPIPPGALALVIVGSLPFLVLGLSGLADTVSRINDPCMTWGDQWGRYQEGGGRAPAEHPCEEGVSWTTEHPMNALLEAAWIPLAGTAALGLGLAGTFRREPLPVLLGAAFLLVLAFPFSLGATVFFAFAPTAAFLAAARWTGPFGKAERWTARALGTAAGVLAVSWMLSMGATILARGVFAFVTLFVYGWLVAIVLLAWWPNPESTPRRARTPGQSE